jgi:hypothetical protein
LIWTWHTDIVEEKYNRLAVDHCIYRYEDALSRVMMLLCYVEDIVAATTDREELRDTFSITSEKSGRSLQKGR